MDAILYVIQPIRNYLYHINLNSIYILILYYLRLLFYDIYDINSRLYIHHMNTLIL